MKKKIEDLKEGDWAYTVANGWERIRIHINDGLYPLGHSDLWYQQNGRLCEGDNFPSLFTYDPISGTEPPHEFREGQVIWVWDGDDNDSYAAVYSRTTEEGRIETTNLTWDHAKPMTIEDIT